MSHQTILVRDISGGAASTCASILETLPDWFGIPESNDDYIRMADVQPGVIAAIDGDDVGITTIVRHSPFAAEIYLMAVVPRMHRHGVGRAMLEHVEAGLALDGVEFLQVKTLSASHPDEGYAMTRAFYLASGFRPLEEFPTLWQPENPALQMIKTVNPSPGVSAR